MASSGSKKLNSMRGASLKLALNNDEEINSPFSQQRDAS